MIFLRFFIKIKDFLFEVWWCNVISSRYIVYLPLNINVNIKYNSFARRWPCFRVPNRILSLQLFREMQSSYLRWRVSINMSLPIWWVPLCFWMSSECWNWDCSSKTKCDLDYFNKISVEIFFTVFHQILLSLTELRFWVSFSNHFLSIVGLIVFTLF